MSNNYTSISSLVRDVKFGSNVTIVDPSNLYECTLGDNVFVGPFVEIQSNVLIGSNSKIQSHSFICELVSIGNNVFIGHGVKFVNDKFSSGKPAMGDKSKWLSTSVGDHVSIGSGTVILPVKICSNVVIGAGSVVTKDILVPGIYLGNPASFLKPFPESV